MNNKTQQELAQIALDNHLFVDNWRMKDYYDEIVQFGHKSRHTVTVMYDNENPIAAATLSIGDKSINIFVNPYKRGKNIGVQLIEQLLSENNLTKEDIHAYVGIPGSEDFFRKAGIACFADTIPLTKKETDSFINFEISYDELIKLKILDKLTEYKNYQPPKPLQKHLI